MPCDMCIEKFGGLGKHAFLDLYPDNWQGAPGWCAHCDHPEDHPSHFADPIDLTEYVRDELDPYAVREIIDSLPPLPITLKGYFPYTSRCVEINVVSEPLMIRAAWEAQYGGAHWVND